MIDFIGSYLSTIFLIELPIHAVPTAAVIPVCQVGIGMKFIIYFEQVYYAEQNKYNKY
jgi:hypothetical protein